MKQFAVIGLGRFGYFTAKRLVENGAQVLGVDIDRGRVEAVRDMLARAVIADATNRQALEQLDVADLDAVVLSVGDRMDVSVLATLHLKELGVKNLYVKAVTADHAKIVRMLGADKVVFPEQDQAIRVADNLTWSNVLDFVPLAPEYSIIEVQPPKNIIGKSLRDSQLRAKFNVEVIAVRETDPERLVLIPDADYVITGKVAITVIGKNENLQALQRAE